MKKWIAIGFAGLLFSGTASAQAELGNNLLGPTGVVQSLVTTLTTADAEPLVNSLAGLNTGLVQGTGGQGLNDVLGGLLVDQDPARIQRGLETVLGGLVVGLESGLVGGGGGAGGLPGLGGLPLAGDLTGSLGGGLDLDGGLPGLPGSAALSPAQLEQVSSLLSL